MAASALFSDHTDQPLSSTGATVWVPGGGARWVHLEDWLPHLPSWISCSFFWWVTFSGDILKKVAWEVIFLRCYICELVFNLSSPLNEGFSLEFQVESIFLWNCESFILHHVVSRVIIGKSDAIVNVYCCVLPVFVFLKLLDVSLYPCIFQFHTVCGSFFLLHAFVYCPGYAMGSFNLETQVLQFLKVFTYQK